MSTKTSFKRIALVAASALAIAGFSAVPANAALPTTTAQTIGAETVTKALGSVVTGDTVTQAVTITTVGVTGAGEFATWTATVTTAPVSSTDVVTFTGVAAADAAFTYTAPTNTIVATRGAGKTGAAITGKAVATLNFTPTVPGDYTITLQGDGTTTNTATTLTLTASPTTGSGSVTDSISLARVTSTPTANADVAVNFLAKTSGITNLPSDRFYEYTGYLSKYPSGGFASVSVSDTAPTTDTEAWVASTGTTPVVSESTSGSSYKVILDGDSANEDYTGNTAVASSTVGAAQFSFTPAVAGDYVLTVFNDANDDGTINIGEAVQTLAITVAARAGVSPALSTVYQASNILPAAGTFAPDATSDGAINSSTYPQPALCAKGTTQCSNLLVTVLNTAGAAISTGWTFGAEITGVGNLGISDTDNTYTQAASSRSVSLTTPANNVFNVSIWGDNTGGTGTVTVYATDADGVKTTLATKKVAFYGTVAKLTLDQSYSILKAGKGTATGIITGLTATSDTPAATIVATDSNGIRVAGLTVTATAADITIVSGGTVAEAVVGRDAGYLYGGLGTYVADVVSATSSVSGGKTVVTYSTTLSTGAKITTTATYTIGGSVATETLAFDKASYSAGEAITLTITGKDSAGNPVFDGAASPAVTFNKATGGSAVAASTYLAGVVSTTSSKGVASLFAPAIGGDLVAQATSGNAAKSTITATASVEGDASSALALDAANAATDAANNAYDEAQNATQAASDALAAVTALAAQVKSLIASVKKLTKSVAAYKKSTGQ